MNSALAKFLVSPRWVRCSEALASSSASALGGRKRSYLLQDLDKPEPDPEPSFDNWSQTKYRDRVRLIMMATGWSSTIPGEVELEVLQSGCAGTTGPALALVTSSGLSYLINAPESLERHLHNSRVKLSSLRHVLCTRSSWAANGGLAGFILSLNAARGADDSLNLHGPPQLKRLFDITRPFYDERNVRLRIQECSYAHGLWENEAIRLDYLPIVNEHPEEQQEIAAPLQDDLDNREIRGPLREALNEVSKEATRHTDLSIGYLISLKPRPGKMNLARCKELGVPVGPLLGKLQNGHSVQLDNGETVTPDMVLNKPSRGARILVVDIPSLGFLPSLVSQEKLVSGQSAKDSESEEHIDIICHLAPTAVLDAPDYQRWLESFGPSTSHMFCGTGSPRLPHNPSILRHQAKLSLICKDSYPLLAHQQETLSLPELPRELSGARVWAEPNMRILLRPKLGIERGERMSPELLATWASVGGAQAEAEAGDGVLGALKGAHHRLAAIPPSAAYPAVTLLGTASAAPARYRNVSAIWVDVEEDKAVLLDCGEATRNQLVLLHGLEESNRALTRLKAVLISHLHQDHHQGLCGLIRARRDAFAALNKPYEPLDLFCVAPLAALTKLYSHLVENVIDFININYVRNLSAFDEFSPEVLSKSGLKGLHFVKVNHPAMAFGMVLRTLGGRKIVYSGDCRPDDRLVNAGTNADLLIHEATFDDSYAEDAKKKMHSTTSEALDVGRRMGAKAILLTHFSSRYQQVPLIPPDLGLEDPVGFGTDFMRVRVAGAGKRLAAIRSVLSSMFAEELAAHEARCAKRNIDNAHIQERRAMGARALHAKLAASERRSREQSRSSPPSPTSNQTPSINLFKHKSPTASAMITTFPKAEGSKSPSPQGSSLMSSSSKTKSPKMSPQGSPSSTRPRPPNDPLGTKSPPSKLLKSDFAS